MSVLQNQTFCEGVLARFERRKMISFGLPLAILAYLVYAAISFDLLGLTQRAKMDNARILLADFVSYKTHVSRDNSPEMLRVSAAGETKGNYPQGRLPHWVTLSGDRSLIDIGSGNRVSYIPSGAQIDVVDYGRITITQSSDGRLNLDAPQPLPGWINASDSRVTVTLEDARIAYTRSKVDTFYYQAGWPLFFFTPKSPFAWMSWSEIARSAFSPERLDPDLPNAAAMIRDFWTNQMWRHSDVFWAMAETILMAFLGTFGAALLALPLGFLAARNMMPFASIRFALRRVFDFIRGVDGLIWTIVLARAFGPRPMTGSLAILLTDTGSFGKIFSEAIENTNENQVEGIRSTGANAAQRARFGVIPQIMPVLLSQILYFLESNTRSATVIGAIVGGGIGLFLTQAIQTPKDWEDVAQIDQRLILNICSIMVQG